MLTGFICGLRDLKDHGSCSLRVLSRVIENVFFVVWIRYQNITFGDRRDSRVTLITIRGFHWHTPPFLGRNH